MRAFLARRTGVAAANVELDAATAALAAGTTPTPTTATTPPSHRWLALGAADLDARIGEVWADLGLARRRARPADRVAVGRRGGACRARRAAARPLRRLPARRADERPRPRRAGPPRALDRRRCRRPSCSSATTARFLARTVTDVVEIDEFTHRATPLRRRLAGVPRRARRRATAWRGSASRTTTPSARSLAGRAQREREWAHAGPVARRSDSDDEPDKNIRALRASTRPSSSPAGRRAPNARWSASRSSTSRASRGQLRLSSCPPPAAAATSSPASTASSSSAGDVHARTDRPHDRGRRTRRPRRRPTARARRPCSTPLLGTDRADRRHAPRSDRASWSARSSRPAISSPGRHRCCVRSRTPRRMDAADARTLLAKFGLVADHVTAPGGHAVARRAHAGVAGRC